MTTLRIRSRSTFHKARTTLNYLITIYCLPHVRKGAQAQGNLPFYKPFFQLRNASFALQKPPFLFCDNAALAVCDHSCHSLPTIFAYVGTQSRTLPNAGGIPDSVMGALSVSLCLESLMAVLTP